MPVGVGVRMPVGVGVRMPVGVGIDTMPPETTGRWMRTWYSPTPACATTPTSPLTASHRNQLMLLPSFIRQTTLPPPENSVSPMARGQLRHMPAAIAATSLSRTHTAIGIVRLVVLSPS